MLRDLFKTRPSRTAGAALYAGAVAQARQPGFYLHMGVADRIDARFELYTLHVILLVQRFAGQGDAAAETSQALFDTFVAALDDALRELGVGDLSVAKKMRKLGEAVYGRTLAYREALTAGALTPGALTPGGEAAPDVSALQLAIARNVFLDEAQTELAAPLAAYVVTASAALAAQPLDELLKGHAAWPALPAEAAA